jgi:hypothetical protein
MRRSQRYAQSLRGCPTDASGVRRSDSAIAFRCLTQTGFNRLDNQNGYSGRRSV